MKLFTTFLLALLATACAMPRVQEIAVPVPDVSATDRWQLTGRLSLTRGDTGWHAGVDWLEQPDRFSLRVSGPLGQGAFQLAGDSDGVMLRDADGHVYVASDLDALLRQVTGWVLPVQGMRYWARGLPDPAAAVTLMRRDGLGRLLSLEQDGWAIDYGRYHTGRGAQWPARLKLVHEDVAVRLVIDRWQLGSPPVVVP